MIRVGAVAGVDVDAAGLDELYGNDGDDRLSGGDGDDVLAGGPGADHVMGDAGADHAEGGGGADQLPWRRGRRRGRRLLTTTLPPARDAVRLRARERGPPQ